MSMQRWKPQPQPEEQKLHLQRQQQQRRQKDDNSPVEEALPIEDVKEEERICVTAKLQVDNASRVPRCLLRAVDKQSPLKQNDIVEMRQPDNQESCTIYVRIHSVDGMPRGSPKGSHQLCFPRDFLTNFRLRGNEDVILTKVTDLAPVTASFVEVTFKRRYAGRFDLWRFKECLSFQCVQVNEGIAFGGVIATVTEIWLSDNRKSYSAYIDWNTRILLRSSSVKMCIVLPITSEMNDYHSDGNTYFEACISFLEELFARWAQGDVCHLVTILLATRIWYPDIHTRDDIPQDEQDAYQQASDGRWYRDFFQVVCQELVFRAQLQTSVLMTIKHDATMFLQRIGVDPDRCDPRVGRQVVCRSGEANTFEALHLVLKSYEEHFIDRRFDRTGLSLMVVTAGTGVVKTTRALYKIVEEHVQDEGVGIDWICMSAPLCLNTPLIYYDKENDDSTSTSSPQCTQVGDATFQYEQPEWIHHCLYSPTTKTLHEAGPQTLHMDEAIFPRFLHVARTSPNADSFHLPPMQAEDVHGMDVGDLADPFRGVNASPSQPPSGSQRNFSPPLPSLPALDEHLEHADWSLDHASVNGNAIDDDDASDQHQNHHRHHHHHQDDNYHHHRHRHHHQQQQQQQQALPAARTPTLDELEKYDDECWLRYDPISPECAPPQEPTVFLPPREPVDVADVRHPRPPDFPDTLYPGKSLFVFRRERGEQLPARRHSCPPRIGWGQRTTLQDQLDPYGRIIRVYRWHREQKHIRVRAAIPDRILRSLPCSPTQKRKEHAKRQAKFDAFLPSRATWLTRRLRALQDPTPHSLRQPRVLMPFAERFRQKPSIEMLRRWQHAFAPVHHDTLTPYGPLWKSLVTPACLPLSTSFAPSECSTGWVEFSNYNFCFRDAESGLEEQEPVMLVFGLLLMLGAQYLEDDLLKIRELGLFSMSMKAKTASAQAEDSSNSSSNGKREGNGSSNGNGNDDQEQLEEKEEQEQQAKATRPRMFWMSRFIQNTFRSKKKEPKTNSGSAQADAAKKKSEDEKEAAVEEEPEERLMTMRLFNSHFNITRKRGTVHVYPSRQEHVSELARLPDTPYVFGIIPFRRQQVYTVRTHISRPASVIQRSLRGSAWYALLKLLQQPLSILKPPTQADINTCQFWRARYAFTPLHVSANPQLLFRKLNFTLKRYKTDVPSVDSVTGDAEHTPSDLRITDLVDVELLKDEQEMHNSQILSNATWLNMTTDETSRREWAVLYYDRCYHPSRAFHMEVQWFVATGAFVSEFIKICRAGLPLHPGMGKAYALYKMGVDQLSHERCNKNPFRVPRCLELAWTPAATTATAAVAEATPTPAGMVATDLETASATATATAHPRSSSSSSLSRLHTPGTDAAELRVLFLTRVVRSLGFLLDMNTAEETPDEREASESPRLNPPYRKTQFVHSSGCAIMQLPTTGWFLVYHANLHGNDGNMRLPDRDVHLLASEDADVLASVLQLCNDAAALEKLWLDVVQEHQQRQQQRQARQQEQQEQQQQEQQQLPLQPYS
ncbi:hypothetical protein PTSG_00507 [Salpingoeca rosetta]|uniref:Vacuolar membrane-associated protein Iml1 N-terminal domain-containing protein n=1 Tax=Salpingoeca rosetta (strain ATCC 50818 / BSB-021) TaxID=946362 RepID=F2TWN5_SALR5|nr:uncharacterized protein PTSG_00507 [Salpingoeca rosetta]EGD72481.1 hypothetical protein PTSG_00507 [Salpingoeca rosetta]|eukprot:XP_004999050.1 hypothetical protein PTSG_00507 [Salpingoeca rosetta]